MTTTPTLPPLPDEDGYILVTIAGRPVEVNAYRNSTMEAYALAAYQAGRDAERLACIEAVRAVAHCGGTAEQCDDAISTLKSDAKGGV